jgi:hypothetical protein
VPALTVPGPVAVAAGRAGRGAAVPVTPVAVAPAIAVPAAITLGPVVATGRAIAARSGLALDHLHRD